MSAVSDKLSLLRLCGVAHWTAYWVARDLLPEGARHGTLKQGVGIVDAQSRALRWQEAMTNYTRGTYRSDYRGEDLSETRVLWQRKSD